MESVQASFYINTLQFWLAGIYLKTYKSRWNRPLDRAIHITLDSDKNLKNVFWLNRDIFKMKVVKFMIKQLFMHLKADLPRQDIQVEIDFLESTLIGQILRTQTGSLEEPNGRFCAKSVIGEVKFDHLAEKQQR